MKAVLCKELGLPENLVLEDVEIGKPGKNEVKVAVKACSVNFPDTLIIQGKYQFRPDMPFTPGSDVSGIIIEVGEDVKHYKAGDEVVGASMIGGFAEEVIIPMTQIFPKPPSMSHSHGASFLLAHGTSYHALKDRGRLKPGQKLLVLGASGGVGLAAVELGKIMGANVIAAASSDEKLQLCKKYGADHLINYKTHGLKDEVKKITEGGGVDVVFDPIGGPLSEQALRTIAWKGRYLVIGFASGDIPKIPLNLALLKGCQIVGVFWGLFVKKELGNHIKNTQEMIAWYDEKKLNPHIHKEYQLKDTAIALQEVMDRKVMGKIVIVND